jgi:hypothetical protein
MNNMSLSSLSNRVFRPAFASYFLAGSMALIGCKGNHQPAPSASAAASVSAVKPIIPAPSVVPGIIPALPSASSEAENIPAPSASSEVKNMPAIGPLKLVMGSIWGKCAPKTLSVSWDAVVTVDFKVVSRPEKSLNIPYSFSVSFVTDKIYPQGDAWVGSDNMLSANGYIADRLCHHMGKPSGKEFKTGVILKDNLGSPAQTFYFTLDQVQPPVSEPRKSGRSVSLDD